MSRQLSVGNFPAEMRQQFEATLRVSLLTLCLKMDSVDVKEMQTQRDCRLSKNVTIQSHSLKM